MNKAAKRRRSNNQGTLEKRGKIWYVRYYDADGKRKRVSTNQTDKIKAKAWMENFMSERILMAKIADDKKQLYLVKASLESDIESKERELMNMRKVPLDEIYTRLFQSEECKKYRPKDIIKETEKQYQRFIKSFVEWVKGNYANMNLSMDDITHDMCGEYLDHILEVGSPDQHRRRLTLLRKVWNDYLEMGCIRANPWLGFKNQKNIKTVKKRILDDYEMESLIKVLENKDLETRTMFAFAMETGQRFGDCCSMKWSYIKKLHIDDRDVDYLIYMPSKTRKYGTEVKVPITEKLMTLLKEIKAAKIDDEYITPQWAKLYEKNNSCQANNAANSILKEAGIKTKDEHGRTNAGMHSLRHGFVSRLALSGQPMTTIQSFVGHAREEMTEYYSHSTIKSQIAAIRSLDYDSSKEVHRNLIIPGEVYDKLMLLKGEKSENEFLVELLEMYEQKIVSEKQIKEQRISEILKIVNAS